MTVKVDRSEMSEARIRRLSAGTILKICLFVMVPGFVLGLLFGLFALLGFDTVRWDNHSVLGVNGLLLSLAMSLVGSSAIAVANFLLIWMGMAVISTFKTTKIQYSDSHVRTVSTALPPQDDSP